MALECVFQRMRMLPQCCPEPRIHSGRLLPFGAQSHKLFSA